MKRRDLLLGLGLLPAASLVRPRALAQERWPARTVTMVVPFPPGGQADLAARPVAAVLERLLGQSVVVENRGGAGGAVGNAAVARAEPDGHTLLMTLSSLAVLPEAERLFGRSPPYEVAQLAPIARVLADPTLLAVPAAAPWRSVQDLVADAKKRPDAIPYGSSGPYGTLLVAMEMFAKSADITLLHVPYRGAGPAVTGLLAGQIQALASAPGVLKPHVDSDLPAPVMTRLRDAMRMAMKDPEVVRVFEAAGSPPAYQDAPDFARFVEADSARLITAVRKIGQVQ